jgi:DNA-binding NtrC family response regulator
MNADVRVVAATNRDLADEIKSGRFREDLFYRLNVVSIHLPPLRKRRGDIPELVEHFLSTRQIGPLRSRVDAEAMEARLVYSWPGNVRELANVLERAQILAENHVITVEDLPESIVSAAPATAEASGDPNHLSEVEHRHVWNILKQEKGNKVHAARILGISRRSLYRLIEKYHLE